MQSTHRHIDKLVWNRRRPTKRLTQQSIKVVGDPEKSTTHLKLQRIKRFSLMRCLIVVPEIYAGPCSETDEEPHRAFVRVQQRVECQKKDRLQSS